MHHRPETLNPGICLLSTKEILDNLACYILYAQVLRSIAGNLVCGDSNIENLEGYVALNCAAATQKYLLQHTILVWVCLARSLPA
jgi:hypothetical protein